MEPTSSSKAKQYGKKILGYPEHRVKTVSSLEWLSNLVPNPRHQVCQFLDTVRFISHAT